MTRGAQEFVNPLAVGALSALYRTLLREDEQDVGHDPPCARLRPDRDCAGHRRPDGEDGERHAGRPGSTVLLATDRPVLVSPAMNPKMHAPQRGQRRDACRRRLSFVGRWRVKWPRAAKAATAWPKPLDIVAVAERLLDDAPKPLAGRTAIVTSGPDPRNYQDRPGPGYIANRSSGRQGQRDRRRARSARRPRHPRFRTCDHCRSGRAATVHGTRRRDARCGDLAAAGGHRRGWSAVADWRAVAASAEHKIKKKPGEFAPLHLTENPTTLKAVASRTPPGDRRRLCRRDRKCRGQRPLLEREQRRPDRRQRRVAGPASAGGRTTA